MIPARVASILVAAIVTGGMSFLVSGIATLRAVGLAPDFPALWLTAWLYAWPVAFPALVILRPIVERMVARWTRKDG